jgi:hypothetical protein
LIFYCQAFLKAFFKAAFFGKTHQKRSLLLGGLFDQNLRAASRAFSGHRLVPAGKIAFWESAAAVKNFSAL